METIPVVLLAIVGWFGAALFAYQPAESLCSPRRRLAGLVLLGGSVIAQVVLLALALRGLE